MKKRKTFDCVEMQHRGGEKIQEETKGMTLEQKLDFWQRRSQELRRRQQSIRMKHKSDFHQNTIM